MSQKYYTEKNAVVSAIDCLKQAENHSKDDGRSIEYSKLIDVLENLKRDIES